MRRKRRKIVRDRLLVAQYARDVLESAEARSGSSGQRNSGICQDAEQADGLERDALAAHVRTGDDERVETFPEIDVERLDFAAQQRVAAGPDAQRAILSEIRPVRRARQPPAGAGPDAGDACQ